MKTKPIKNCMTYLFLISIFLFHTLAYSEGNDIEILNARLDTARAEKKLINFGKEIDSLLEQSPTSPGLWYIKGLWYEYTGRQRYLDIGKVNDDTVQALMKKSNEMIEKAMELDLNYEPHLTAGQYHWVAPGLPIDLKLEAYRRELKLGVAGEYPSMIENVYGSMTGALYDAGRYEEAIEIMNEMIVDPEWLKITKNPSERVQAIKQKIAKFEQKIQERDGKTIVNEKDEAVQEKIETAQKTPVTSIDEQVVKKEDVQHNNEDTIEANNKAFIIGIVLAVLLLVGFIAVKRKKK